MRIADASWAISYVTDDDNVKIQAVVDAGCVPHLVKLLDSNESAVIIPALRSVGNIVTGSDSQVINFYFQTVFFLNDVCLYQLLDFFFLKL